jgi:hypothetical protein
LTELLRAAAFREFPSLSTEPAVCFVLDEKLRIVYCNPAWDLFARRNGAPDLCAARMLGIPVLDCSSGHIQEYYRSLYQDVLAGAPPASHDFHCSSPEMERLMRMKVHGLRTAPAVLVVCSLRVERPHTLPAAQPIPSVYRNEHGFMVMCSNCRRTRRAGSSPEIWDWVPEFVAEMPPDVSHGICKLCLEYYYSIE